MSFLDKFISNISYTKLFISYQVVVKSQKFFNYSIMSSNQESFFNLVFFIFNICKATLYRIFSPSIKYIYNILNTYAQGKVLQNKVINQGEAKNKQSIFHYESFLCNFGQNLLMSSKSIQISTFQDEHFPVNLIKILQQILMFFPMKNMVHHIKRLLFIKFKKNNRRNKVHSLTISKLRKGGCNSVKYRFHFARQLFNNFIAGKSSIQIEINLLTLLFSQIESIWFSRFHNKLRPYFFSKRVRYSLSNVVNKSPLIGLFKRFDFGDNLLFPFLNLKFYFLLIIKISQQLM